MQQSVLISSIIAGVIGVAIVGYAAVVFIHPGDNQLSEGDDTQTVTTTTPTHTVADEDNALSDEGNETAKPTTTTPSTTSTTKSGSTTGTTTTGVAGATGTTTTTTTATTTGTTSGTKTISLAEVATHASAGDCWLVLSGSVYNVTTYISQHPGGRSSIVRECGKDDTSGFNRVGAHGASSMAALLAKYFIGYVGQ